MTMLWLGGQKANLLESAATVTASPAADSLFPTTALYDRHPSRVFRFGSRTSAPSVTVDLDLLGTNGSFESWSGGAPVGWTVANSGTGSVSEESVVVDEGTRSAALGNSGAGVASVFKDFTVRTGQSLRFLSRLNASVAAGCIVRVRNQDTGNYCDLNGAWQSASQDFQAVDIAGAGGWTQFSTDVVAESYETIQKATTVIRLQVYNETAATTAYVDGVYVLPAYDFVSIHGHNIDKRSAPVFRSSNDNFVSNNILRGTFTLRQPSMYVTLNTALYERYVRVLFADTNSETSGAIYMGEFVVGHTTELRGPALPLQANYSDQQVQVPRRFGAPALYGMGRSELRSFPMTIRCESVAERDEFFEEWRRTLGGYPVVVVPHDGDSHTDVIYGQMPDALPHSWATKKFVTVSTTVDELPLPLLIG